MVLRRDSSSHPSSILRSPNLASTSRDFTPGGGGGGGGGVTMANEQPVTKRQRMESKNASVVVEDGATTKASSTPPDIIAGPQVTPVNGSGGSGSASSSSTSSSPTVSTSSSITPGGHCSSGDEIDNVARILMQDNPRISPSFPDLVKVTRVDSDLVEIHNHLAQKCLCGVSDNMLRRIYQPDNGRILRNVPLKDWPAMKIMQFLSNIQLLFDVYLPQNIKGFICMRVLEACERLILHELALIDQITQLCDHENRFVRFLAGRVLSSFLLIAKKYMNVVNDKLKPLVENLTALDQIDAVTVRRVGVSAEILRRIVEWKDTEEHPLDDDDEDDMGEQMPPAMQAPNLSTNYFATHYNSEMVAAATSSSSSNPSSHRQSATPAVQQPIIRETESGCQMVTLTDSESFDTGSLKFGMIETLKEEWPSIVDHMSTVIRRWRDFPAAEETILAFLSFWESIISVRANLPIVQTLYFHEPLNDLKKLLSAHLPGTVYKQMLTLFNEALCYGSTLALQDLLPKPTCAFAAQIVLQVRSRWLLRSLPQERAGNPVNFIGLRGENIEYEEGSLVRRRAQQPDNTIESLTVDKSLLQKLVLLVLKSVAVTAKEVRSDSSDSSIESTDFQAVQDIKTIEESIRDALKKLEDFMKDTLQFLPETHFSEILIHLFGDQDDYLIEAMVCTLDVTVNMSFRNNAFPELVAMLNPVFTFLEFLKMIHNSSSLLLDLLISNETCFLLYLLRFLKYIRLNWEMFETSCRTSTLGSNCMDTTMGVLNQLRLQIQRLVRMERFPYDIAPVLRLLDSCDQLYQGDQLS